jgi:hypothetical protein
MSTPTSPDAPKRSTSEKVKMEMSAKEEAKREKMMADAEQKLAYIETIKEMVEKMPSPTPKMKIDMMVSLEKQIQELEMDALGKPRYSFNLHYPIDIGFAPNGRPPVFADETFTSVAKVVKFIKEFIKDEDLMFDKEEYAYPSERLIEDMLEIKNKIDIDVNYREDSDDEDEMDVPFFTLSWKRIN